MQALNEPVLDFKTIHNLWLAALIDNAKHVIMRLRSTKADVLVAWKAELYTYEVQDGVEQTFYRQIVEDVLEAGNPTDIDGCLDKAWAGVLAHGKTQKKHCAYGKEKYMLKADHETKRCPSLDDYFLYTAAQHSVQEFMVW